MNKITTEDYILHKTEGLSEDQWLELRNSFLYAVGGSDIAAIMNMSDYSTAQSLFRKKTANDLKPYRLSQPFFWGKILEKTILDVSQYIDIKDNLSYLENYPHQAIRTHTSFPYTTIRKCQNWLYANVDGLELKSPFLEKEFIFDESSFVPKSVIEIKTITDQDFAHHSITKGLPVAYILQVMTYLEIFSGFNPDIEGLVFCLRGGRDIYSYRIKRDKKIVEEILNASYDFCESLRKASSIPFHEMSTELITKEIINLCPKYNNKAISKYIQKEYSKTL